MRVVERCDLGSSVELLDQRLDLGGISSGVGSDLSKLSLELVLLSNLAEHLSEVDTLLRSDLGSWGVLSSGTVTHGVGSLSTEKSEVVVNEETSSLGLRIWEFVHQVSGDLSRSVTGRPNQETIWDLSNLLVGVLDDNAGWLDVLDHGSGEDINLVGSELVLGVLDELLGKGGENVGEGLDQRDLESVGDFWVPFFQVILLSVHGPSNSLNVQSRNREALRRIRHRLVHLQRRPCASIGQSPLVVDL